jgi:hypothetical protein
MKTLRSSSIEALEDRIAPSGVVTVTFSAGNLTVTGDASDNGISIDPLPGGFGMKITADGSTGIRLGTGTAIVGGNVTVFGVTGDLRVTMGEGVDGVGVGNILVNKNATFDLGGGTANALTLNGGGFLGNLAVMATGGNDTVTIQTNTIHVGKDTTFSLGNGTNLVAITTNDASFAGNLTYTGGTGADTLGDTAASLVIGKNLVANMGTGVSIVNLSPTASLTFGGNVTVTAGNHDSGNSQVTFSSNGDLRVHGNLSITMATGDDTVTVFPNGRLFLDGNTTIAVGAGATQSVKIQGTLVSAAGNVAVTSTGANAFTLAGNVFISGSLAYTGGASGDTVDMTSTLSVAGAVTVDTGAGNANVQIGNTGALTQFGSTFTLRNAAVAGAVSVEFLKNIVIYGVTTVSFGAGADTLTADELVFNNTSNFNFGAGSDNFFLDNLNEAGQTFINANMTVNMGAGTDTIIFGAGVNSATQKVNSTGTAKISVNGGADSDVDLFQYLLSNNNFAFLPTATAITVQ